jgi:hypothetical protein
VNVTLHSVAVDDPEALERDLVAWLLGVLDDHRRAKVLDTPRGRSATPAVPDPAPDLATRSGVGAANVAEARIELACP